MYNIDENTFICQLEYDKVLRVLKTDPTGKILDDQKNDLFSPESLSDDE